MRSYPLAIELLPSFLDNHFDEPSFRSSILFAFPEHAQASPEAVIEEVRALSAKDSKASYLKKLQGAIWKDGYEQGKVTTPLYDDVLPTLNHWQSEGRTLAIFSSGSVQAQKMFFGHVKGGHDEPDDVNSLFVDNFDTVNAGPKMEEGSYLSIAKALGKDVKDVLFLSDNVNEIKAATLAGMTAVIVDRPGNALLRAEDKDIYDVVETLSDISFARCQ